MAKVSVQLKLDCLSHYFFRLTWTLWFEESATTIELSGPTAIPRGHVKHPGSLPRLPTLNCRRRFCRYWLLGEEPAAAKPDTKNKRK